MLAESAAHISWRTLNVPILPCHAPLHCSLFLLKTMLPACGEVKSEVLLAHKPWWFVTHEQTAMADAAQLSSTEEDFIAERVRGR